MLWFASGDVCVCVCTCLLVGVLFLCYWERAWVCLYVCVCVCSTFARGAQQGKWGVTLCLEQPSMVLEKGAPAPFWCVPLFIHVLPVRWLALACPFVWRFRWPEIWRAQNSPYPAASRLKTQQLYCVFVSLYPCVCRCRVLCVCLFVSCSVSSCLHVHSHPLVPPLAAPWFSVRQLKQCAVLQGLFRAAKALWVLQGLPVRKATRLEMQYMTHTHWHTVSHTHTHAHTHTHTHTHTQILDSDRHTQTDTTHEHTGGRSCLLC